jgi:hypothetical protein
VGAHLDIYSGSVNNPTRPSVRASSANNLILSGFGTGATYINSDGGSGGIRFHDGTGPGEVARITPTGRMGIGTSNPAQPLHVTGNIRTDGGIVYSSGGSGTTRVLVRRWDGQVLSNDSALFEDDFVRIGVRNLGSLSRDFRIRLSPKVAGTAHPWKYTTAENSGGSTGDTTIGSWYTVSNDFGYTDRGGGIYQLNLLDSTPAITYRVSVHLSSFSFAKVIVEAFYQ